VELLEETGDPQLNVGFVASCEAEEVFGVVGGENVVVRRDWLHRIPSESQYDRYGNCG
jgi:hypothetical protein